ncbi:MAG: hypothetical protein QG603_216 [Patescibacteria group bacterium]|jgi:hypothetical protein|nr:hypothetical protein [Patescibacteria group bacterium]MDQ5970439.1 hypothetical protein [Patescibacteria group bacterium]
MREQMKLLQVAYQVARDAGDLKQAGQILIHLSSPFPCVCTEEFLSEHQGRCHCDRYASLLRPATAQELMLSGC